MDERIKALLVQAQKDKEEAVKNKEREVRYEEMMAMIAYRRRKVQCRDYVLPFGRRRQ